MSVFMPAKRIAEPISIGPPSLLSTREAAKLIGVSTRTLHRYKDSYKITYIKLDGLLKFEQSAVENFMQRRTVKAA
jgi:excisionase family DNA binding protein